MAQRKLSGTKAVSKGKPASRRKTQPKVSPRRVLGKEHPGEVEFTVRVKTYGKPEQQTKTVRAAARALYAAFGDNFEIVYDGTGWKYDSQAADGSDSGYEKAFYRVIGE
jgi:hypothetical protein